MDDRASDAPARAKGAAGGVLPVTGLVLAGGAARGAYEVGVLRYIFDQVTRAIGRPIPIDIVSGTSVGAINACALAAYAHEPSIGVRVLERSWTGLQIGEVLRPSGRELLWLIGDLLGRKRPPPKPGEERRGGIIDPSGIESIVRASIPFPRIRENISRGHLRALTVSTTDVASGRTVIFVERAGGGLPLWSRDPTIVVRAAIIGADHALASGAVPMLFPAVRIGEDFYCDGGLRQNVPLSPARRLGAEGLVVVNPRHIAVPTPRERLAHEASYPGPLFLLGKALNALLLDRIDNDIDRLKRINAIMDAGTRRFGPEFVDDINAELSTRDRVSNVRPLEVVHIRASRDIGRAAGDYVRSREFAVRAPAAIHRALLKIADWEGTAEADLTSYLLFDGAFAAELLEMGSADARARHDDLCAFYEHRIRGAEAQ